MTNELQVNQELAANGISFSEILVQNTPDYEVFKLPNGKFEKRMKYQKEWSYVPETQEELLRFFQLMNEQDNPEVTELKNAVGEILEIKNVFHNPYKSFDEETGTTDAGVNTMIETNDGKFFVTSSKSVYWNLKQIFDVFGKPNTPNYLGVKVAVVSTKQKRGNQLSLKLLGLSDEPKEVAK